MDPRGTYCTQFMVTARYFREKPLQSQTERFYWTMIDFIKFDRKYDHMEQRTSKKVHVGSETIFLHLVSILTALRAKT